MTSDAVELGTENHLEVNVPCFTKSASAGSLGCVDVRLAASGPRRREYKTSYALSGLEKVASYLVGGIGGVQQQQQQGGLGVGCCCVVKYNEK